MADSPNRTILSRRNALGAAGASLAFAALSTRPASSAEADHEAQMWMAKWHRLLKADAEYGTAVVDAEDAQIAAQEEYPSKTLKLAGTVGKFKNGKVLPEWSDFSISATFIKMGKDRNPNRLEIEQHFENYLTGKYRGNLSDEVQADFIADGRARQQKALAEFDTWREACSVVEKRHNVPSFDEAEDVASERFVEAEEDIIKSDSTCFAAVAVKLALWHTQQGGDHDEYPPERSAMAALVGATALAGLPPEFWSSRLQTAAS